MNESIHFKRELPRVIPHTLRLFRSMRIKDVPIKFTAIYT